jgi:hypothetical protein
MARSVVIGRAAICLAERFIAADQGRPVSFSEFNNFIGGPGG